MGHLPWVSAKYFTLSRKKCGVFPLLLLNTSKARWGEGVSSTLTDSVTPVGCPTVQFNSDTIHLELGSDCTG